MIVEILIACGALAAPEGQIAWLRGDTVAETAVWVKDTASGSEIQVGPGNGDGAAQWSPDGAWLAFATRTETGYGIATVRPDGSGLQYLAHALPWNDSPRWSPDGSKLAYLAGAGPSLDSVLTIADLDTGSEEVWAGGRMGILQAEWLPSLDLRLALDPEMQLSVEGVDLDQLWGEGEELGALVVIASVGAPGSLSTEIFVATRSQMLPILPLILEDSERFVEWNALPDRRGRQIAFESNDGGDREIFVLSGSLRGVADVSNHRAADWAPAWRRDGQVLAFESFRDGRRGLFSVYVKTGKVAPIAASPAYDAWHAAWAPNGDWLAFVSNQTGDPELYALRPEDPEWIRLTNHPGLDLAPQWRPETKK